MSHEITPAAKCMLSTCLGRDDCKFKVPLTELAFASDNGDLSETQAWALLEMASWCLRAADGARAVAEFYDASGSDSTDSSRSIS